MIIECINCNKKFNIDSNLIPENGRLLQCNGCNHKWFFKRNITNKLVEPIKSNNQKNFLNSFKENIIWGGAGSLIDLDFRDVKMNQKKRIVLNKLTKFRKQIRKPFWKFW